MSKTTKLKEPELGRPKTTISWGPFSAILGGLALFILPQVVAGVLLGFLNLVSPEIFDRVLSGDEIGLNFALYGTTELITIGLLTALLKWRGTSWRQLGVKRSGLNKLWIILPAFIAYLLLTGVILAVAGALVGEQSLEADQQLGFEGASAAWEIILAFVSLVLVAPIVEEILFRGYLFGGLRSRWSFRVSALISAVLFGLAHGQLNVGLDTFALGLFLAYVYEKSGNVWVAVALHGLKNLLAFTFLFLVDIEELSATSTGFIKLVS